MCFCYFLCQPDQKVRSLSVSSSQQREPRKNQPIEDLKMSKLLTALIATAFAAVFRPARPPRQLLAVVWQLLASGWFQERRSQEEKLPGQG